MMLLYPISIEWIDRGIYREEWRTIKEGSREEERMQREIRRN